MLSEEYLINQRKNLHELGNALQKQASFSRSFLEDHTNPKNERNWFLVVRDISIHGTFTIQNILGTLENYKEKSESQISFYIAKAAIQPFLEVINAYELSLNKLLGVSVEFQQMVSERIGKRITTIEESWTNIANKKSKELKKDVLGRYKRLRYETKFIRDTLHKYHVISDEDVRILEFAWSIRNSMHADFVATRDIELSDLELAPHLRFKFMEGEELYHQGGFLSFHDVSGLVISIHYALLRHFNQIAGSDEA